jgi:hypothetical protein
LHDPSYSLIWTLVLYYDSSMAPHIHYTTSMKIAVYRWFLNVSTLLLHKKNSFILWQEGTGHEFLTFRLLYIKLLVFWRWSKSLPGVATNKLTPFTSWSASLLRLLPPITYPRVCEWYFINFLATLCVWTIK